MTSDLRKESQMSFLTSLASSRRVISVTADTMMAKIYAKNEFMLV